MTSLYFFIFFFYTFLVTFILTFIFKKNKLLLDNLSFSRHKNISNKKYVKYGPPLCGGIVIFLAFFFIPNFLVLNIFIFFILIIGIFSDLNFFPSPLVRIFLQSFVVAIFVFHFDIKILDLRISFLNELLKINLISVIFTIFCIITLINGTNFIDGLNTLVLGYFIAVLFSLIFLAWKYNLILESNIIYFLIILLVLFFFNFFGKIYLGDSGSYIIAFTSSFFLLNFFEKNPQVSPYFIAILLWYPAFENLFSVVRRIWSYKKTYNADNQHLHHLLFFFVKKNFKFNKNFVNTLTAILINIVNTVIFYLILDFYNKTLIIVFFIFILISFYLFIYFYLRYLNKKNHF